MACVSKATRDYFAKLKRRKNNAKKGRNRFTNKSQPGGTVGKPTQSYQSPNYSLKGKRTKK